MPQNLQMLSSSVLLWNTCLDSINVHTVDKAIEQQQLSVLNTFIQPQVHYCSVESFKETAV